MSVKHHLWTNENINTIINICRNQWKKGFYLVDTRETHRDHFITLSGLPYLLTTTTIATPRVSMESSRVNLTPSLPHAVKLLLLTTYHQTCHIYMYIHFLGYFLFYTSRIHCQVINLQIITVCGKMLSPPLSLLCT